MNRDNIRRILDTLCWNMEWHDKEDDIHDAILAIEELIAEAYKRGHIDGSIEVVNNTCEICHAYPMTVDCNNAGCDK